MSKVKKMTLLNDEAVADELAKFDQFNKFWKKIKTRKSMNFLHSVQR